MIFTAAQLVCHLIGDYLLQSQWMAEKKTSCFKIALYHALWYTAPFMLLLDVSWQAATVMIVTHALIDRFRIARYWLIIKNYAFPFTLESFGKAKTDFIPPDEVTGSPKHVPFGLGLAILIIADNLIHILINALAIFYL